MFWSQCKDRGAYLPQIPGEGMYRHFHAVVPAAPENPLHFQAPLAVHRTKGGHAEREEGRRGMIWRKGRSSGRTGRRRGGRTGKGKLRPGVWEIAAATEARLPLETTST